MKKKVSKLIYIIGTGVSFGLWNKNMSSIVFIMCLLFWVESFIEEGEMKEKTYKQGITGN